MKVHVMMRKTVLMVSIFLLFFTSGAIGATYYVSPSGSNYNNGSSTSPWKTFQHAINRLSAGDTLIAKDGVYKDYHVDGGRKYIAFITRGGSAAGGYITIKAENKWGAILYGNNNEAFMCFSLYKGSKYIKFEDFVITGFSSTAIGANPEAVVVDHVTVKGCKIYEIGYWRATWDDIYGRCGIGSNPWTQYWTIDGCKFYKIGRLPYPGGVHNYKHDHALYLQGKYHVIKNNIFYDNTAGWAIKLDGSYGSADSNKKSFLVTNNTFGISENPEFSGHIRFYRNSKWSTYSLSAPKNVTIKNNVFYGTPGNTAINIDSLGGWPWSGTVISHNVTNTRYMYSENLGAFIRNYVTASNNITSFSGNMGMKDPSNEDFSLMDTASNLINSGTSTNAPSIDYLGVSRPQDGSYDIGAYEFMDDNFTLIAPPQNFRLN